MVKTLQELMLQAEAEINALQEQALQAALSMSTATMVGIAMQDDQSAMPEATELFFEQSLAVALKQMQRAIEAGYRGELTGRQEIATAANDDLSISFTLSADEKEALYKWPVLGHTIEEIALSLSTNLLFDVRSVINGPERGLFPVEQLPGNLEIAKRTYATGLSAQVSNAYTTGAQAAREMVKGALGAAAS